MAGVTQFYRLNLIRFADPHEALLELQPGEVVTREVKMSIQKEPRPWPAPPLTTTLADLRFGSTLLSELTAGEEYQVQLAHGTDSGWPNHVWWWMECAKDEIIRDVGKKGPDGLATMKVDGKDKWAVRLMSGIKNVVTVDMQEGAVLRIIE